MMKINEIPEGTFFTIMETPSYPKLRTEYGYIDARDEIKNHCGDYLPFHVRIMSDEEVLEQFTKYGWENLSEITELKEVLFRK